MEANESKLIVMSEAMIKTLMAENAKTAAKVAIEMYEGKRKEQSDTWHRRKAKNTKILLQNYRSFKAMAENAVYNASQLDSDDLTDADILDLMMGTDRVENEINSIKRSAVRTALIVKHIDTALTLCEAVCSAGRQEEYRNHMMMVDFYISPQKVRVEELAEREGIETPTAYGAIDSAAKKLSGFIFGVDGARFA